MNAILISIGTKRLTRSIPLKIFYTTLIKSFKIRSFWLLTTIGTRA